MEKLSINHWDEQDRPREKMMRLGAAALSDAELLAILIGSGSDRQSAVDLMRTVLSDCNYNLNTLGKKTVNELCRYHGMGPAKAITILAACELGKRRKDSVAEELNQSFKLIKEECISHGGITETAVDIRIIIKDALLCNTTILAVCHNHPSGSKRPSRQDDQLTDRIRKACELMRIYFLDHVIITDGSYYSYREEGRL